MTFKEQDGKVIRTEVLSSGEVEQTEFYASYGDRGPIWERQPGKLARTRVCKGLGWTTGTLYLEPGESLLARIKHEYNEAQREKVEGRAYVRREFES